MFATVISYIPGWAVFGQAGIALLFPIAASRLYKALYALVGSGRAVESPGSSANKRKGRSHAPASPPDPAPQCFSGDYAADLQSVKAAIGKNSDLHFKEFTLSRPQKQAVLLFVEGMQNDRVLHLQIMQFLMFEATDDCLSAAGIAGQMLPFSQLSETKEVTNFNQSVLFGHIGLLIEGLPQGLLIETPEGVSHSRINFEYDLEITDFGSFTE